MHAQKRFTWILLLAVFTLGGCATLELIPSAPGAKNSDAILILPGLGMKGSALDDMHAFAQHANAAGFDVFLADYQRRKSVDAGVEALHHFVEYQNLSDYERIHVFAYILGGYTLNRFLEKYPMDNLANVVYDRSPLQELAPRLASEGWFSILSWMAIGPVISDLAKTPYAPVPLSNAYQIGLIVENRATRFIRKRKKRALSIRPLTFEPDSLGQPFDAAMHVRFNHDEMYSNFDVIGPELIHFFAFGDFSESAPRHPLGIDPFTKH